MILAFVIWSAAAVIFLSIGISSRAAKKEAGFFTFRPPQMKDIPSYNRAVSKLWFAFAVIFEILGIPFLFLQQGSPLIFISVIGLIFLLIGIIGAYCTIEDKYRK